MRWKAGVVALVLVALAPESAVHVATEAVRAAVQGMNDMLPSQTAGSHG
jgi:hypothetical protein